MHCEYSLDEYFTDALLMSTDVFSYRNKKNITWMPPLIWGYVIVWFYKFRFVWFIRVLHHFQQSFSHIMIVSGRGRELRDHFRVLPHWNIISQTHNRICHQVTLYWHQADQFRFLALLSQCWASSVRAASTIFEVYGLIWSGIEPITSQPQSRRSTNCASPTFWVLQHEPHSAR